MSRNSSAKVNRHGWLLTYIFTITLFSCMVTYTEQLTDSSVISHKKLLWTLLGFLAVQTILASISKIWWNAKLFYGVTIILVILLAAIFFLRSSVEFYIGEIDVAKYKVEPQKLFCFFKNTKDGDMACDAMLTNIEQEKIEKAIRDIVKSQKDKITIWFENCNRKDLVKNIIGIRFTHILSEGYIVFAAKNIEKYAKEFTGFSKAKKFEENNTCLKTE